MGRELKVADQQAIEKIVDHVKANDYKLSEMIQAVVLSEPFQSY
jgi:hypothetical protein